VEDDDNVVAGSAREDVFRSYGEGTFDEEVGAPPNAVRLIGSLRRRRL
jgi:hypothetical protein